MKRSRRPTPTNFTVVRVKRDVLRRSAIGVMATNRSRVGVRHGLEPGVRRRRRILVLREREPRRVLGAHGDHRRDGDDQSYQGRFEYNADRYGARAEYPAVGRNFNPEVGFTRRADFRRSFGELRFSPRPTRIKSVRKFTWSGIGRVHRQRRGVGDARIWTGHFITRAREQRPVLDRRHAATTSVLRQPFIPAGSTVAIAPGGYTFGDVAVAYAFGAQRRVSGTIAVRAGDYYDGTIRSVTLRPGPLAPGRVSILQQFSLEPTLSVTRIALPDGSFTTRLARARVDYGFSPLMFASGFFSTAPPTAPSAPTCAFAGSTRPGSELFLVYTDERDTHRRPIRHADHRSRSQEPRVRDEDQSVDAFLTPVTKLY